MIWIVIASLMLIVNAVIVIYSEDRIMRFISLIFVFASIGMLIDSIFRLLW